MTEPGRPLLEALELKNKILSDRAHAYWNRSHPRHEAAAAEVFKLNEKVYGTRPVGGA